MRMLVVTPSVRGFGVGKSLVEECFVRAKHDEATR